MGDLEHDNSTNGAEDALKSMVERLFNVEDDFANVKAEYKDTVKDLKTEFKAREEQTGYTVKQIVDLVKIRQNETNALDEQLEKEANMQLYGRVFGFNAEPTPPVSDEPEEDEDPLS